MNKLQAYFNQPAPVNRKPWVAVLISSLLVLFLLGLFQPFGLSNVPSPRKWSIIVGFAMVTAVSTGIAGYVFPLLFKRFYDPVHWTNGKNILNCIFIILIVALGNFLFDWFTTNRPADTFIPLFIAYMKITFLMGIIPAIVVVVIIQNSGLKQNLADARDMNKSLLQSMQNSNQSVTRESEPIRLSGNTRDEIEIHPEDLLYVEASGNYVHIYYNSGADVVRQKQLRATIGQMEKELESFSFITKCHRAFLVNTTYINNVEGNSQGFLLSLRLTKNLIPVSRTYTKTLRNILETTI